MLLILIATVPVAVAVVCPKSMDIKAIIWAALVRVIVVVRLVISEIEAEVVLPVVTTTLLLGIIPGILFP
jgi:hypothetical protein